MVFFFEAKWVFFLRPNMRNFELLMDVTPRKMHRSIFSNPSQRFSYFPEGFFFEEARRVFFLRPSGFFF